MQCFFYIFWNIQHYIEKYKYIPQTHFTPDPTDLLLIWGQSSSYTPHMLHILLRPPTDLQPSFSSCSITPPHPPHSVTINLLLHLETHCSWLELHSYNGALFNVISLKQGCAIEDWHTADQRGAVALNITIQEDRYYSACVIIHQRALQVTFRSIIIIPTLSEQ